MTNDDWLDKSEPNRRLGSCPHCGRNIWESDMVKDPQHQNLYICISCTCVIDIVDIIPF